MTAKEQVKNLVAIPSIAVIHIQKIAPGPPIWIANATPAMLPIPMVPAMPAVSALKWEICPGSLGLSYLPPDQIKAVAKIEEGRKL